MSSYRYDTLENRWVIIAPHRLKKPTLKAHDMRVDVVKCPFCEGNEALSDGEIDATASDPRRAKNAPGWINRVVSNRYKAVSIEADPSPLQEGLFSSRGGFGAHEILIETPGHDSDLALMKKDEVEAYLQMVRKRLVDLRKDSRILYISVFKNVGILAGETLVHPHTQIVAFPFVPLHIDEIFQREESYYRDHSRHLVLDEVSLSIAEGDRIVWNEGDFCLYAPFASGNPFELRIAPRCVLASLADAAPEQIEALASILQRSIALIKRVLGEKVAYNMVFRDAVSNDPLSGFHHTFYLMIVPRLFGISALESEDQISINPMPPEEAARLYKERL
ncbi:MAG: hypothetical protein JXK04_08440 [Campylobacterales bacterium]|nr:hypothetical protein [Campylobacterales bacterium]